MAQRIVYLTNTASTWSTHVRSRIFYRVHVTGPSVSANNNRHGLAAHEYDTH